MYNQIMANTLRSPTGDTLKENCDQAPWVYAGTDAM